MDYKKLLFKYLYGAPITMEEKTFLLNKLKEERLNMTEVWINNKRKLYPEIIEGEFVEIFNTDDNKKEVGGYPLISYKNGQEKS